MWFNSDPKTIHNKFNRRCFGAFLDNVCMRTQYTIFNPMLTLKYVK